MRTEDLDTPAVLVDLDRVERNLRRAQDYADRHGLRLRPHIKTHKLVRFARWQMDLGAHGITCQKLGEAECMAAGGIADILVTYNILGAAKLRRLAELHARVRMAVVADSREVVEGYAATFTDPGHRLRVLVECDTGAGRCGVQTPREALELARTVAAAPGLAFAGLMTFQPRDATAATEAWLAEARDLLAAAGLPPATVSAGGTPDLFRAAEIASATEYRPGTYIYSDRMQVAWGHGTLEDCALTVLTTVVARPTAERAILDAGSKVLAADTAPVPGHGHIREYPEAVIRGLSEEHAIVDVSACPHEPRIGERVRVIPNHVCPVVNLTDRVHLLRGDRVEEIVPVDARGRVT